MKRLIILDSHALIHRAYHALPPLTSPMGEPTNAVYGFTTILLRILREFNPDYIAACFDLPGPTFRHAAYEEYKATRPETPTDLISQFAKVKETVAAFGIPAFEKEGFEADDMIGTIVRAVAKKKDLETIIVSGDMDVMQLIGPQVKVYAMRKGVSDMMIYDEAAVQERFGFKPKQIVDYKALKGDTSDNIKGVKGIGEKTAVELINEFGSVEGIYQALKRGTKKISPSVAEKLRVGEKDAEMSLQLATIHAEAPITFNLDDAAYKKENPAPIRELFQKFGFFALLKRFDSGGEVAKKKAPKLKMLDLLSAVTPKSEGQGVAALVTSEDIEKFIREAKGKRLGLIIDEGQLFFIRESDSTVVIVENKALRQKSSKTILEGTVRLSAFNAKEIIRFFHMRGINLPPVDFDLMLAAYLSESFSRDFSYGAILMRELSRPASPDIKEEFVHFFELESLLRAKLGEGKMQKVLLEIELPVAPILASMEEEGVLLDSKWLGVLAKDINAELEILTKNIYEHAGESFNINSPRQLSYILFEKLGLRTAGLRKTAKGGVISTGAAELEKLRALHPMIPLILEFRELMKLKTTYVDVLPELADKEGRIHTTFNQTGTSTGRLSSLNPNMQNIPIMSEYGRKVRNAFTVPKGWLLASFDYSQIELRVAAHMSQDKKMIEAFRKGMDIHRLTASEIYKIPQEQVTRELRRAAKTLNFGILYGMGAQALAENTGMSREEAKTFIEEYFRNFQGVKKYLDETRRMAEERGYVETLFGRRRYIPEINSPNWQIKREAERMAINMPIQGTATGDIVKMAMIAVVKWIASAGQSTSVRMVLQVHDELLFEIREDKITAVVPEIRRIMEQVTKLDVPLVVDCKVGKNWGEQKVIDNPVSAPL